MHQSVAAMADRRLSLAVDRGAIEAGMSGTVDWGMSLRIGMPAGSLELQPTAPHSFPATATTVNVTTIVTICTTHTAGTIVIVGTNGLFV